VSGSRSRFRETIADGLAVNTPVDSTFPIVRELVDDILLVSDGELIENDPLHSRADEGAGRTVRRRRRRRGAPPEARDPRPPASASSSLAAMSTSPASLVTCGHLSA
jgi:hypothetical protein